MDSLTRVRISSARLSIWPGRRLSAGGEIADTAFDTLRVTAATMSAEVSAAPEIQSSFWSSSRRGAGGGHAELLLCPRPRGCHLEGGDLARHRGAEPRDRRLELGPIDVAAKLVSD